MGCFWFDDMNSPATINVPNIGAPYASSNVADCGGFLAKRTHWEEYGALQISRNRRFLCHANGRPFFWLGDTAWELFHTLNREEADHYLLNRAKKGFSVIQVVALAELGGIEKPNAFGRTPLLDGDPARPDDQGDYTYWDHVDYIVQKANSLGLVVGFLPTWGSYWHKSPDEGGIFTPANAESYGEWLGRRFRESALVWILGGDRPVENECHREIIRRMAEGLSRGDGGTHLRTFHANGANGSAAYFHNESWLDFNMRQNGHVSSFTGRYDHTRQDYNLTPAKPVVDGEPIYEDIPVDFDAPRNGHSTSADVRRALYWDLFSGAFGHTYGHNSVWQMWSPGRAPHLEPIMAWREALNQPGATQMRYAKKLLRSRPFFSRIPDQEILLPSEASSVVPGAGIYRLAACRDISRTFGMVYVPVGRAFSVQADAIHGHKIRAWWFDPRTGNVESIGKFRNEGARTFTPPSAGELLDWILVLDNAHIGYPPPGHREINEFENFN